MCTQPKLAPEKMLNVLDPKPDILTNLGFFGTESGNSIFNVVSNGVAYSKDNQYTGGWGVTTDNEIKAGDIGTYKWSDFISSYPTLVLNGNVLPNDWMWGQDLNYKAHRCIWGWTKNQEVFFNIGIEGSGATFQEEQKIITTLYPEVEYAFNMDGGGSLVQYFDGTRISDSGWERPVDTVVAIWIKEEQKEEQIRYRVQLGAFSKKSNAENYLKQVQALKTDVHDYSDAYVKFVSPYYKVQCGAFSKKENAERLSKDLKEHGFDNYITTK